MINVIGTQGSKVMTRSIVGRFIEYTILLGLGQVGQAQFLVVNLIKPQVEKIIRTGNNIVSPALVTVNITIFGVNFRYPVNVLYHGFKLQT